MTPTIRQVMKCYRMVTQLERMKTGRPGEATVTNVLRGVRLVCEAAGIAPDSSVSALTRARLDSALLAFAERKLARITAWSYICQLRGLFARWALPYYRDADWQIPQLELPTFRAKVPRYVRPSPELLARVKAWYETLDGEKWLAATLMLEFAMRNGDVLRLTPANLANRFLAYTPHKTELSSGRRVCWPVHQTIWKRIEQAGGLTAFDITDETFDELNRDLRALGFRGTKASYELRKICIDHVYQRYGAEMAVSISGDDIKTISHYYADPSQPNIGNVRIIDLI